MAHNISQSKRAAFIRRKQLTDYPRFRFTCQCEPCKRTHEIAFSDLLHGTPAGMKAGTIGQAIMRMRCSQCGNPPAVVTMTDGAQAPVPVWGREAF